MVVTFCILVDAEVIRMQVYRYIVVIKRVFDEGTSNDIFGYVFSNFLCI